MARTMQTARRSIDPSKRSSVGMDSGRDPPMPSPLSWPVDHDETPLFEVVSQNLASIGSLTIEQFLQSPLEIDKLDVPHNVQGKRPETSPAPLVVPPVTVTSKQSTKAGSPSRMQCIAQLHRTCQRVFGRTDILKFEFIEVDGPNSKPLFYVPAFK